MKLHESEPKWRLERSKVRKWSPEVSKSEPKGAHWSQKGAKRGQSEPKGNKREPREPKGRQRETKRIPKGAKGPPKCIQKSTFGKGREKVANISIMRYFPRTFLGAIFHQKSMEKSMRKSMPKKWWKSMNNRCTSATSINILIMCEKGPMQDSLWKTLFFFSMISRFSRLEIL